MKLNRKKSEIMLGEHQIVKGMSTDQIALPGPVYCMRKYHCPSFLDRETRRNKRSLERIGICPQLLLSGGGGSTKSGIANYVVVLLR